MFLQFSISDNLMSWKPANVWISVGSRIEFTRCRSISVFLKYISLSLSLSLSLSVSYSSHPQAGIIALRLQLGKMESVQRDRGSAERSREREGEQVRASLAT